jgi:choline dehydrogenase-like flavoprotein
MKTIKTDICIVGTGFSGTFLASRLNETSARVLLVEKGAYLTRERIEKNYYNNPYITGKAHFKSQQDFSELKEFIYDDPEFSHYDHINNGNDAFTYSGHHLVGGNSHLWFGNALRKVPNDFRTNKKYGFGVDWPISYNDLEEYYYQAEKEMGVSGPSKDMLSPFRKDPFPLTAFQLPPGAIKLNGILKGTGFEITPSPKARLPIDSPARSACCGAGTCWIFCPADARYNCLTTHLKDLQKSEQMDILDKVTISRLIQKGDRIVEAVGFDRKGNRIRIEADIFILAANAIENARILLLSQFHHLETGFQSRSRAIGRYLTDQVGMWISISLPFNLYTGYEKTVQSSHSLSFYDGPFRKQYSSLVIEVFLSTAPFTSSLITNSKKAKKLVFGQIRKGQYGNNLRKNVFLNSLGKLTLCLEMEMLSEERNCVRINPSRKNQFGDPTAEFHFSIWDQEYLKRSKIYYQQKFTKIIEDVKGKINQVILRNTFDHMLGTCRMGEDPEVSVVDENLKSHDHKNLYIVGGSSFPTAGSNNPTLTIVALALRCGNYLRNHLKL